LNQDWYNEMPALHQFRTSAVSSAVLPTCTCAQRGTDQVRIAHAQDFPPLAEVKDGKSEGLAVEILRAAAARSGLQVNFVAVPFEQVTLEDGRADAAFPLAITPERRQLFDFTEGLLVTGATLYVRAPNVPPESLTALSDRIVVTPRTGPLAAFIERTAPTVKLVVAKDYEDSLTRLMRGEADAAALNYHVGTHLAARLYPGQLVHSPKLLQELPLAVAVPKGKGVDLVALPNAGISAIRADGTWQRINDRWTGRRHGSTHRARARTHKRAAELELLPA
jgi:ABC-type amino acid transport substrate-binding protein